MKLPKKHQNGSRPPARVLMVEDQPLIRHGLRNLLETQPDIQICAEAGDYQQAFAAMSAHRPDLVTVEIMLDHTCGLQWVKQARSRFPQVPLLVISFQDEVLYAERALRAGALGFVDKQEPLAGVLQAVRTVLRGNLYVSERVATKIAAKLAGRRRRNALIMDVLTDRELQIFELIGSGYGTREIVKELSINISTVDTYRARIKKKLRLPTASVLRREAIAWKHGQEALR